jgi:general secretion pathway protein A
MYEQFYGLTRKPFSLAPDPHYLFWGRDHSFAYGMLEYGVLNHAGFTVITGEIGCGKTTLLRQLLHSIDGRITVGLVSNTMMAQGSLLEWILLALNQPFDDVKYVALFRQFQEFVISEYQYGRHVVLMIDEAQNLDLPALEELRMLSNINSDGNQLLQVILVGQPELRVKLQRPELVQFAQRISSDFHLGPLPTDEAFEYIYHRLALSGATQNLFSRGAAQMIAEASGGIPRIINSLCDASLVYGFGMHAKKITVSVVHEVLEDRRKFGLLELRNAFNLVGMKSESK